MSGSSNVFAFLTLDDFHGVLGKGVTGGVGVGSLVFTGLGEVGMF